MTGVAFAYHVDCPPERVKELMLNEAFLHAFVDEQHATDKTVTVDCEQRVATLAWTIRLDGDLPGLVTRFVGRTADLHLVLDFGKSRVDMTAKAKRVGTLACDLRIEPWTASVTSDGAEDRTADHPGTGSVLHVDGRLSVSGAFGSMAETTVRDEVVKPVFREDLVRLLNAWCSEDIGEADAVGS